MRKKKQEFISEYTLDNKMYQEFSNAYLFGNNKLIVLMIVALLLVVIALILKDYKLAMTLGLCELIYVIVLIFVVKRNKKINYNRMLESRGVKGISNKLVVNSEKIEIIDTVNGNKIDYSFEQIIGVIESENLIILKLKYNLGIIISKDMIKGGTSEELVDFLMELCVLDKKSYKKYNSKMRFGYMVFILVLVLLLGLTWWFNINDNWFFNKTLKTLESNDYDISLYSPEDAELVIYGISDKEENNEFYIYSFKEESIAKDSFEEWLNDEIDDGGEEVCSNKADYYFCNIKFSDRESYLIRNKRVIFYGGVFLEEKEELNRVLEVIDDLK